MNDGIKTYFESQYERNAFFSPRDVRFAVYGNELWQEARTLLKNSKVVVDLGAGGGTLLYNIAKETDAELIAVDFSDAVSPFLRNMAPRAKILSEDVTHTTIKDGSCDFVFSTMTVEHVDNDAFFNECYRILAKNGYLFITSVMKKKGVRYFYKNKNGESVLEPSHLREYTSIEEFLAKPKKLGFNILKVVTPRIKFPLIDPLLKFIFRNKFFRRWDKILTTRIVENLRLLSRVAIPGYFSVEVLAQKL